ncbi:hypothetical protein EI77_04232 [Prosthecobacter fusiformis]|uniref:Uncharacterized protein n=1 Tax=Prosthecobacter fusiformis TaxID=48464 RepID=A0A4R7RMX5_9BACT|nr:hypothetical protein [Prosthecobacter fusiformis]TDU64344.1 hypothetical protein EI77_04232 [Prosthecobacter fusiformis]
MASSTRSLKLPPDLLDVAEKRAKILGYPSWSAYVKGLIRYDALCQGPHSITLPWANLPLMEQDKVDAKLLKLTQDGVGVRGQLLKRILQGEAKL